MDRAIDPRALRRRRWRRLAAAALALGATLAVLLALSGWMRPSVQRRSLRTARVERGPVEATLVASGTLVPDGEHVLSCPLETRLVRVVATPGTVVAPGDPIVELDAAAARLAVLQLDQRIALARNEAASESLRLEDQLGELEARRDVQKLEIQSREQAEERSRKMVDMGIAPRDELTAAGTQLERARIELQQIERSIDNARRASTARLEHLELQRRILDQDRAEAARRLDLAAARSDRHGVVTWVLSEEGAAVRQGDVLARLADISAFRVEARVADVHAARLAAGMPAVVQVGEARLAAQVAKVLPAVENGAVQVELDLVERGHAGLRANQRVDVHLVTERKPDVLRLPRGPFAATSGAGSAFVVRGGAAVRRPIRLGLAGFDWYEVVSGLAEGDEVVLSDMSDYEHAKEVRLR